MRVKHVLVENFGSYKELTFDFDNQGLTLLSGATGSGKSTLCDIIPWVLFGKTAKNGAVDEILSWTASAATSGRLTVEVEGKDVLIVRTRGKKAKDNDLYFIRSGETVRGKDVTDTQKLIDSMLNTNLELYLSAAYLHEFSQTSSFFTATAKIRRQIMEQLVDLSTPKLLTENISEYRKDIMGELNTTESDLKTKTINLSQVSGTLSKIKLDQEDWHSEHAQALKNISIKNNRFEQEKQKSVDSLKEEYLTIEARLLYDIEILEKSVKPEEYFTALKQDIEDKITALGDVNCEECGALKNNDQRLVLLKMKYGTQIEYEHNNRVKVQLTVAQNALQKHKNPNSRLLQQIQALLGAVNPYGEQLETLISSKNPHYNLYADIKDQETVLTAELTKLQASMQELKLELNDLDTLLYAITRLRSNIIENTISNLEQYTNKLLTDHFDAEIRVTLETEESDKLDITLLKNGNQCVYTQLSKGQRQLLKLCLGFSIMRAVSNQNGTKITSIFLDEAFDGLDDNFKVKAYGALQEVAQNYNSVFVVEHNNDLKTMFSNQYEVSLINGYSEITKT